MKGVVVQRFSTAVLALALIFGAITTGAPRTALAAPAPWTSTADMVALENLRLLDQRVRLKSAGGTSGLWIVGTYLGMRDGEIRLQTDDGITRAVPKNDLIDFQVKTGDGSHSGTGALVGAGIGGAVGLARSSGNQYNSRNNLLSGRMSTIGAGVFVGAIVGALFGGMTKSENFAHLEDYLDAGPERFPADEMRLSIRWSF